MQLSNEHVHPGAANVSKFPNCPKNSIFDQFLTLTSPPTHNVPPNVPSNPRGIPLTYPHPPTHPPSPTYPLTYPHPPNVPPPNVLPPTPHPPPPTPTHDVPPLSLVRGHLTVVRVSVGGSWCGIYR